MHRFHHWHVRIEDARDEGAVSRMIQDYRHTLSPSMIGLLPPDCQVALENPDIPSAALTLLHAEMKFPGSAEAAALLHEISRTYAAAAVRIADCRSIRSKRG